LTDIEPIEDIRMDLKLRGKSALITGSTAGIGLEIARQLAAEGADVIICGRDQAKLDAAADIGAARSILADAATAEGAAVLLAAVPAVDILVNNLGIYESKPFAEITDEDWRRFFEVNVLSGARLARPISRACWRATGGGSSSSRASRPC
jgi:NAD(P)-dependent dehydrogenase (short-subunit alcohol dehydrogenase family)